MKALLYLETNFLLGLATGRYELDSFLGGIPNSGGIAVPHSCFMESLAAIEGTTARRRRLTGLLKRRISKLTTELFLPRTRRVVASLEAARQENEALINDAEQRLSDAIDRLVRGAVVIAESPDLIAESNRDRLLRQPTDNFILHTILRHAQTIPDVAKGFLTENRRDFASPEASGLLKTARIVLHGRLDSAVQWLQHNARTRARGK